MSANGSPNFAPEPDAEVVVEEVGGVRVVGAPAEQEDAVERAGRVGVEERRRTPGGPRVALMPRFSFSWLAISVAMTGGSGR